MEAGEALREVGNWRSEAVDHVDSYCRLQWMVAEIRVVAENLSVKLLLEIERSLEPLVVINKVGADGMRIDDTLTCHANHNVVDCVEEEPVGQKK